MPPSDTTTATRKGHPLLTAVLDEVPASALGPKERAGLAKALRRVDALGVVDERTGRPYVVEERLRDLLRPVFDEDEISAHIDDLRAHAPEQILDADARRDRALRPVPLTELLEAAGHPADPVRPGRLKDGAKVEDVRQAVRKDVPGLDDAIFDGAELAKRASAIVRSRPQADAPGARATCPSAGACIVLNIGFWGFLTIVAIFATIGAVSVLSGPAAPATVAGIIFALSMLWPMSLLGWWWTVSNCLRNPCWRA